jgi:hypothetical protein
VRSGTSSDLCRAPHISADSWELAGFVL